MFERIETMRMAAAMTDHAAQRQKVVARNIANADTPGFKAADLEAFADSYRSAAAPMMLRGTRPGHMTDPFWTGGGTRHIVDPAAKSPNGNSVSLEDEMFKMAEIKHDHGQALAVYRSGLDLMRASLGRGR